jgi:hypothetical protein
LDLELSSEDRLQGFRANGGEPEAVQLGTAVLPAGLVPLDQSDRAALLGAQVGHASAAAGNGWLLQHRGGSRGASPPPGSRAAAPAAGGLVPAATATLSSWDVLPLIWPLAAANMLIYV